MSAWNWAEGDDAALGPDGPIPSAQGSKLLVGAGAVAGALARWLHYLGAAGSLDRSSHSYKKQSHADGYSAPGVKADRKSVV